MSSQDHLVNHYHRITASLYTQTGIFSFLVYDYAPKQLSICWKIEARKTNYTTIDTLLIV